MKRVLSILMSVMLMFSVGSVAALAKEIPEKTDTENVIGFFDAPLSEVISISSHFDLASNSIRNVTPMAIDQVRVRSTATYSLKYGVTVHVTLYSRLPTVNPKFTNMTGMATVAIKDQVESEEFAEVANGTKKISANTTVDIKGNRNDKGTVTVIGQAMGYNISGLGDFEIAYPIKLDK